MARNPVSEAAARYELVHRGLRTCDGGLWNPFRIFGEAAIAIVFQPLESKIPGFSFR
jgi:hypothetical protein